MMPKKLQTREKQGTPQATQCAPLITRSLHLTGTYCIMKVRKLCFRQIAVQCLSDATIEGETCSASHSPGLLLQHKPRHDIPR